MRFVAHRTRTVLVARATLLCACLVLLSATDGFSSNPAPLKSFTQSRTLASGSGIPRTHAKEDLRFNLTWSGCDDVDLHVIEPGGERIWWNNRQSASGGSLEVDINAGECITQSPQENTYWPSATPPAGTYQFWAHLYEIVDEPPRPYTLRVIVGGAVVATYSGTLTAESRTGPTHSFLYTPQPICDLLISPGSLPNATTGAAYSQTLSVTNGTAPYEWAIVGGSLPPGLSLGTSNGAITGTPNTTNTYSFRVRVRDSGGDGGCTEEKDYQIRVVCPSIAISPSSLPDVQVGVAFERSLSAIGGTAPYRFELTGAAPGLTLRSDGLLSGTIASSGNTGFNVRVTDAYGCTATQSYTLQAECPSIAITPAALPGIETGALLSVTLSATGGHAPYAFSFVGTPPSGLSLTAGGSLTGTINESGSKSFAIRVIDANGCSGQRQYTLSVTCPVITIGSGSIAKGTAGVAYTQTQFTAAGGASPYTFVISSGGVPGLTLSSAGLLSGTPSRPGTFEFTVSATDANGCAGSRSYSAEVVALTLKIESGDRQRARVNQPLAEPLVVRVLDVNEQPRAGITVTWNVQKGEATFTGPTSTTNENGLASNSVKLGSVTGAIEIAASISAGDGSVVVVFHATADADLTQVPDLDKTQQQVATALTKTCEGASGGDLAAVCQAIAGLSDDDVKIALNEIAPEETAAQGNIAIESMGVQLGNIASRLAALRGGASRASLEQLSFRIDDKVVPASVILAAFRDERGGAAGVGTGGGRLGVFVNGTIGSGERRTTETESGFDLKASSLTAGVDYRFSDRLVGGIAAGHLRSDSDLKEDGGSLESSGWTLSLYGVASGIAERTAGTSHRSVYVDAIAAIGRNDYDSVRNIDIPGMARRTASAKTEATQLAAGLGSGIEMSSGGALVELFTRANYSHARLDGYEETGAGALNLVIGDQEVDSLLASAGVAASYAWSTSWGVVRPSLRVTVLHEFADDARLITARFAEGPLSATFQIPTEVPDRDFFNASAGIHAVFPRGVSAFVHVSRDVQRDDLKFQSLQLGLRFEF